jgi:hypothetical protein
MPLPWQEEVKLIGMPIRLWAAIQQAVQHPHPTTISSSCPEESSQSQLTSDIALFSAVKRAAPESPPSTLQQRPERLSDPAQSQEAQRQSFAAHQSQGRGDMQAGKLPALFASHNLTTSSSSIAEADGSIDDGQVGNNLPADIMQRRLPASDTTQKGAAAAVGGPPRVRRVPLKDTTPYVLQVGQESTEGGNTYQAGALCGPVNSASKATASPLHSAILALDALPWQHPEVPGSIEQKSDPASV